jgi:hypothetical protein
MARAERLITLAQPLLYGAALVLLNFAGTHALVGTLMRPMLIVLAVAAALLGFAWLVTRSWTWAPVLASIVVLFSFWERIPAFVLAGVVVWWGLVRLIRLLQHRGLPPPMVPQAVARVSGIFSLAFLCVHAGAVGYSLALSNPRLAAPDYGGGRQPGPNVYLVLLDGYPRADTLLNTFEINNQPFLDSLAARDFAISADARSNYNKTWLTLASMLNGAYVSELLDEERIPSENEIQLRWLHSMIDRAAILDIPRTAGYRIRTIPPPFTSAALTSADDYVDNGHISELEVRILSGSPWTALFRDRIARFLAEAQRSLVHDSLETTARLAEEPSDQAQFVLAHIHSPHTPFVLPEHGAEGVQDCFPSSCAFWSVPLEGLHVDFKQYRDGLAQQLAALNTIILDTVDRIIDADPSAAVILMSDHGIRYSLGDPEEQFRILLAARTPGKSDIYPQDASAVNVLRALFSAYLGSNTPPVAYRAWLGPWRSYLHLEPFRPDAG